MITKKQPSLFHYTTSEALLGMIAEEKICMWATHHQYLNDPQEYYHGIDCAKNHFPDQSFEDMDEFYIISLSQRPDFLPLWSMYSQNGFGIMLGFDSEIQDINVKYTKSDCAYQITQSTIEQLNQIKRPPKN